MIKFIISFMLFMSTKCYQIKSVAELERLLLQESKTRKDYDECLKTNNAFIFNLKSGEVILMPNGLNDNESGILFKSRECYWDCIKADRFPLDNPNMPIYEKYQQDVLALDLRINDILNHLNFVVDREAQQVDSFDINALSDLLIKVRMNKRKIALKEKFYTALALGEYVRRVNNGEWLLLKRYGRYNPFYIPAIQYSKKNFYLVLDHFERFYLDEKLTPKEYARLTAIKNPINTNQNTHAFEFKTLGDAL